MKYPNIEVKLCGDDGNAFAVLARMSAALNKNGVPTTEIDKFMNEAMASDYDHLLQTCMEWVNIV